MKSDTTHCCSQHSPLQVGHPRLGTSVLTHTGLLTERLDLKRALLHSLHSTHRQLRQVRSLQLIRAAIIKKSCDVAIIDIERHDIWPSLVFAEFDGIAAFFPIIMLCKDNHSALDCMKRAENTVDIFPYDAVRDPRFGSVIEAARFRAEAKEPINVDRGFDRLPLSAD